MTRFIIALLFRMRVLPVVVMGMASTAYADDFNLSISRTVAAKGAQIPYALHIRLREAGKTRMGIAAVLDMRHVQANVPGLFSGVLQETCKAKYAVAIAEAHAEGKAVAVSGQFQAKFFLCDDDDPKTHYRGALLLGQNVNFQAKASAEVKGQCLVLKLVDVTLDPTGFLGGVADVLNLTEKAQTLILEKSAEVLAKHPICPELPPELAMLEPDFRSGGTQEIGKGGIGAYLNGSVDVSATTLVDLLLLAQAKKQEGTQ
ncbi:MULTISPECIES: hypothetical protein [Roseobacteraceae]|nr:MULTISPECIES: hypothetical protein [Roseobacteraceae]MBT3141141.1 hypothetical protein [Falsiruegeria litorea]MBT8170860.1 hypothetical protein [Falsiruegeria litorea]